MNPDKNRARPCPMCEAENSMNVISVYTKIRFHDHVRAQHPGLDPATLWLFPLPNRKGVA
jgi:hypothetical protein